MRRPIKSPGTCGRCDQPAVEGRKLCTGHLAAGVERVQKWRAKQRESIPSFVHQMRVAVNQLDRQARQVQEREQAQMKKQQTKDWTAGRSTRGFGDRL